MNGMNSINMKYKSLKGVDRVKAEFDAAEKKVVKLIKGLDKEIAVKQNDYNMTKFGLNNPFLRILRNIINEMKTSSLSPLRIQNDNDFNNFPYNSLSRSTTIIRNLNNQFSKLEEKEIMIRFLDNKEFKSLIFEYLYKK